MKVPQVFGNPGGSALLKMIRRASTQKKWQFLLSASVVRLTIEP
jgi:hypothetical protein